MAAVIVAAQATLMQARYGCTMFGCRTGFECDAASKACKPLREQVPVSSSVTAAPAQNPCVGSADGLVALCTLSVAQGSFQIRTENVGPKAVVLSLRGLGARVASCDSRNVGQGGTAGAAERGGTAGAAPSAAPAIKPLGLRFLAWSGADPRDSLFLSPGPTADLEIVFDGAETTECVVELEATFAVGDHLLKLRATQPGR
ncbi:MAG: hypothetical protein ABIQ16_00580 [Polyangiaceae bacterium]